MTLNASAGGAAITAGRAPRTYLLELIVTHTEPTAESARALLWRHGLPEDVIDGVLCLHAQELTAVQREFADEEDAHLATTSASVYVQGIRDAADRIDPTKTATASAVVSPPPSRAAEELAKHVTRSIFALKTPSPDGSTHYQSGWDDGLEAAMDAARDAVLAVLPVQDDRAAVLLEAADHLAAMDPVEAALAGQHAWVDAANVLRRLAAEAQNAATAEHHTVDGTRYLCHTDDHYCPSEARPAGTQQPETEAEAEAQLELKDYEYGCPNCSQPIIVGHRAQHVCTGAQQQPETEVQPRRGDQFEAWLKAQRDLCFGHATSWGAVDGLLDQYRLHADTSTPLGEHVCEGQTVGDCECLKPHLTPSGNVRVDHLLRRQTGEPAPVAQQPETEAPRWVGATELVPDREITALASTGLVGYRQNAGRLLHCLAHKPAPASRYADFHEVTADELDDGGICVHPRCGRDLLAPWPAAPVAQQPAADGEETRTTLPCNWARTRYLHAPHDWEPQPGMNPVHCPGSPDA